MNFLSMLCAVAVVEMLFLFSLLGWGSLAIRLLGVGGRHAQDPFYAV